MNNPEKVTIGIVNYNGRNTIKDVLDAVYASDYPDYDVILVDNGSTDGSAEYAARLYPSCEIINLGVNIGSAGARNACIKKARTRRILLLDNDIIISKDCLTRLMEIADKYPNIAALHPHILDKDRPDIPQLYNGGYIHYTCAFTPRPDIGEKPSAEYEVFPTVSGAALLIDRNITAKIGLFDEDYFFNWEDGDFTVRLTAAGYVCVNVPGATVYHASKPRGKSKVFYQVRNRWYFILKIYDAKTILLLSPALFFYEVSQMALVAFKGRLSDYLKANLAVIKDIPKTLKKRRKFRKLKRLRDKKLLCSGNMYIPPAFGGGKLFVLFKNAYIGIFDMYWNAVSKLL